jgi:hypothetical protein
MSKYPNSGTLGKNNDRREGKNDSNSKGKASVTCAHCGAESEYWLAGWTKQGDNGPWVSISFKPKDGQAQKPVASEPEPFNDDIPF